MKILITGDFVVTDNYRNKNLIDKSIKEYFSKSDFNIVNLEAPICNISKYKKLYKSGPNIRVSEDVIMPLLNHLKANLLTLANNHILDYGQAALINTFRVIEKHNLEYIGAGNNFEQAKSINTIKTGELSVAIINFCENEWSTTTNNVPGANPLDIIENSKSISTSKKTHDKVICVFHGGHQLNPYPSPSMQKLLRFYVDQGANAIICHHTHCISGYEIYREAPIVYGLGNFLFTLPYKFEGFHEGIVAELCVQKNEPIRFIPKFIKQDVNTHYLQFIEGDELFRIQNKFNNISNIILDAKCLDKKWNEFILSKYKSYLFLLSANSLLNNRYFKFILDKLNISIISKHKGKILLNLLRCESHNEASIEVIKKFMSSHDN